MEIDPEIHPHTHRIGHRWIDLALALSALALSVASIIIAVQNEAAMKRLVTANSWPYLELRQGNFAEGERIIHFDVRNSGIGPATLEKLVVSYDGRPVSSSQELLARCCDGAEGNGRVMINLIANRVLAPRDDVAFLSISRSAGENPLWDRLDKERLKVDMKACYSSVFGEYWTTSLRAPRPVRVDSCDTLEGSAYDAAFFETGRRP